MEYLKYILKFFYRIRWWLIILPILTAVIAWFASKKLPLIYDVKTTIYTGIISGYNIESGNSNIADAKSNMANLLNIITAEKTLKQVSLRLLAECIIHGNPEQDNNYILAAHYREIMGMMSNNDVKALIDKNSVDKTVANFLTYERPSKDNFIYQLLNYSNPYFSIKELTEKLIVKQLGASDMIDISYSCDDPGIAFNTLEILNKEFIKQYQEIRFGETDNVIAYFENELKIVGKSLTHAEDSLISYNIDKRIINYGEQTKQVTIMDADHQMKLQQLSLDYASTKALADFLERKLGTQAKAMMANSEFIKQLNKISELNNKIAMENINPANQTSDDKKINKYKDQLKNAEESFSGLADIIGSNQSGTTTDNIAQKELVNQWLDQVLLAEKTKAELSAMDTQRQKLDGEFLYFSPIGATINRQERNIGFVESTYMSLLNSLNAARLRQKNLQMTSATLRVMNPPAYPLNALPTKRAMLVLATYLLTFLFITGYFIFIEILDRTLRDKFRAERITGGKVLGVFPGESPHKYRRYNRLINDMGMKYISKSILPYFEKGKPNIINLISTESKDGKTFIANELDEFWSSMGFKIKRLTYNEDFNIEDKKYILAQSIQELDEDIANYDIILVEHPELKESSISPALLKEATINLLVTRANRTWKNTDQVSYNKLNKIVGDDSLLYIYLNKTSRDATQEVIGQLPPYSRIENMFYRLSQFGLTAEEINPF